MRADALEARQVAELRLRIPVAAAVHPREAGPAERTHEAPELARALGHQLLVALRHVLRVTSATDEGAYERGALRRASLPLRRDPRGREDVALTLGHQEAGGVELTLDAALVEAE